MIDFTKPQEVTSPRDLVKILKIVYSGGAHSYSIAKLEWNKKECYGIRWNVSIRELQRNSKKCIGNPSSRGFPTWFILPTDFYTFIENKYPEK